MNGRRATRALRVAVKNILNRIVGSWPRGKLPASRDRRPCAVFRSIGASALSPGGARLAIGCENLGNESSVLAAFVKNSISIEPSLSPSPLPSSP